jgi:hypothetical protein
MGVLVPTAPAATPTATTTASAAAAAATTTSTAAPAAAATTAPTATVPPSTSATAASAPTVKLSPTGSGSGTTVTASVKVEGCPAGKITIADTIGGGTQTIATNGAPATVVSHGTPGTYSVTATCVNGAHASVPFVVTKVKGPSIKLSPASTGPTPTTINVSVQGCPPGKIKITDTINDGSQTIKKDKAPATIVSQGNPGTYSVTAKCSDGAKAQAPFVVTPDGPIQTGGGSTFQKAQGPGWPMGIGLAMLILGSLGAFGLGYRWWRRRDSSK